MKRAFSLLVIAILATAISCSQATSDKKAAAAAIEFKELEHDFGTIVQNSETQYVFEFTNTGKSELVINNVQTSCGCTVPEWSNEPIKKGRKGYIKVKYNTHAVGSFAKTINVYSNASNSPVTLRIKGTVTPEQKEQEKKIML